MPRLSIQSKLKILLAVSFIGLSFLPVGGVFAQTSSASVDASTSGTSGPIRLRQPQGASTDRRQTKPSDDVRSGDQFEDKFLREQPKLALSEFEAYVQRITNNRELRRFGHQLTIEREGAQETADFSSLIPADYAIAAGDEIIITMWGSVEADLRLVVDRTGRIHIPRVGSVLVAGTRYSELSALVDKQARRVFRNFEISASLGQLRGIRVFVTGFAAKPGVFTVSSLATLSSVLFTKAEGPSPSGSFRDVELRRGGRSIAKLDLYDLLLSGRRDADSALQAEDVIHVGPVGKQVAMIGSVNKAAIYELKAGESVADLIQMSGGLSSLADRKRIAVERLDERNASRIRELTLPDDAKQTLEVGDVVRAFSAVDAVLPLERQNKRVRVEGEVQRPGEYVMPPGSTVADVVSKAGGFTGAAYMFGTEFTRETVRVGQVQNYDRALRDLELELSRKASARSGNTGAEEQASQASRQIANERLIQRLREIKPTGRVVLQLAPDSRELPNLPLEDGDRIYIPATATSVGVFGSVFNAGSFLYANQRTIDEYLRLAGSPTRTADTESIFVIRANGSVESAQQTGGTFFSFDGGNSIGSRPIFAGDTVYVPEQTDKTTFLQNAKDWTQVLYQLGLGLAAIVTISK